MILEEVELRNFRSHRSTRLRFNEGITVIVGDNGSGKTSILEAVNFALFREAPGSVKLEELVRRGGEKDGMRVSLVFQAHGRRYRVTREVVNGKSISRLYYLDGEIIASGERNRQTTREIEKRVHMDAKLFSNAMYIRQGQIDALLTAKPWERKELIGKLIGTQDLENAYNNMRVILGEYEGRIEGYREIPLRIRELEEKIGAEEKEIAELKKEIIEVKRNLAAKSSEKERKEREMEILEKALRLEGELRVREKEASMLREKLREIEDAEKTLLETKAAHKRYERLEGEIKELEKKKSLLEEERRNFNRVQRELEERQRRVSELKAELEGYFKRYSAFFEKKIDNPKVLEIEAARKTRELEEARGIAEKEAKGLEKRINELKGQNTEIQRALEELESAGERCPVCSRPLSKEHKAKVQEDYQNKIQRNKKEMEKAERELAGWITKRQRCEEKLREAQKVNVEMVAKRIEDKEAAEEEISKLGKELLEKEEFINSHGRVEETLREKEAEKASLRASYERYIAAANFLRKNAPEKGAIQERIAALQQEVVELRREIEKTGITPDAERLEKTRREIRTLFEVITKLASIKSAREAEAGEKERNVRDLAKKLEELRSRKKEGEKLEKFVLLLKKIRSLFHKDNLQRELRARSKPLIERYTREEFDKFHLPYSDITLSEDFDVVVYGPNGEVRMDMLSGGERIAAALALRIGIAKALSGSTMELLMLDEPTIHLDATRRRELVEIVKKLATIPQTIVVTHDKEFESAADKLLQVEKIDGISRVIEG